MATKTANRDKFRFWFPVDKLEKAVDKDGNTRMVIGGIASTSRKDVDEEIMDTSGFELDYFEERGIINWNHSNKPDHVIGEPIKIENRDEGLYVESLLYPDNKLAKSAYALAETLKKHSKRRKLGYSIEGKVISRDKNDPRIVKKAMITNLALTISPKNADSLVDIIKGNYHEVDDYEYEIEKSVNFSDANGGKQYIIDITRPDGMRVTVDEDLNINIAKALDTESGKALMKESVDKDLKDLTKSNRFLTYDECMDRIKSANSVIDVENANKFITTLNQLAMSTKNSKTSITDDLLEKALSKVGLYTGKSLKKSNDGDDEEELEDDETGSDEGDASDTTAKSKKVRKSSSVEEDETEEDENDEPASQPAKTVKKGNKSKPISKVTVVDDDNTELIKSVAVIAKAALDEIKGLRKENNILKGQIDEINDRFEEYLDTPANGGRKSIAKPVNKNFKKSLGTDEEEEDDNTRVLSLSRDKNQILDMLDEEAFNKGQVDHFARNQMSSFEISNRINKTMLQRLEKNYGVTFVD